MMRSQFKLTIKFGRGDYVWRCSHPGSNEIPEIWRVTSAWKDQDGDVWYRARSVWVRKTRESFFRKVGKLRTFRQRTGVHSVPPLLLLAAMGESVD